MRRTRSRHAGSSVRIGATTPNRNGLIPPVAIVSAICSSLLRQGRPSWAASHPYNEQRCPDPTPPPGFPSKTSGAPDCGCLPLIVAVQLGRRGGDALVRRRTWVGGHSGRSLRLKRPPRARLEEGSCDVLGGPGLHTQSVVSVGPRVAEEFGIRAPAEPLRGGENRTVRAGALVLRREHTADHEEAI